LTQAALSVMTALSGSSRIDLTRRPATESFVLANGTKRHAPKGERLARDLQLCDPGVCRLADTDERSCNDTVKGRAHAFMPRSNRRDVVERPKFLAHFDSSLTLEECSTHWL
jgi:hypothetical protein